MPDGLSLLPRLAGLWEGPATQTPLGTFATMSVDFRAVTPRYLFGRSDQDANNNLRFGFSIETFEGEDVLVYRNGGLFQGTLRDMRTKLIEVDEAQARYRFCHVHSGCGYIDALFDFGSDTQLLFDVKVKGMQHVLWNAQRLEQRPLPNPFPAVTTSLGDGTGPFPAIPSLRATVSWSQPLAAPADVWLLLSTQPCGTTGACATSRTLKAEVPSGAQQVVMTVEQLHGGPYRMNAILDRNRNLVAAGRPDTGDAISTLDAQLTVEASGETAASVPIYIPAP